MSSSRITLEPAVAQVRQEFNGRWGRLWARTSASHSFSEFWATLTPDRGSTVLEVACGVGNILIPMARAFPDTSFVGIDISEQMVSMANERAVRQNLVNIRFEVGDMTHLRTPGESVDHVIVSRAFGHYQNLGPIFSELARVLRPGGAAMLISQIRVGGLPWMRYRLMAALAALADPGRRKFIFQYLENTPALEDITQSAVRAGFVVTGVRRMGFLACIVAKKPYAVSEEGAPSGR